MTTAKYYKIMALLHLEVKMWNLYLCHFPRRFSFAGLRQGSSFSYGKSQVGAYFILLLLHQGKDNMDLLTIHVWAEGESDLFVPASDFNMEIDASIAPETLQIKGYNGQGQAVSRFRLKVALCRQIFTYAS